MALDGNFPPYKEAPVAAAKDRHSRAHPDAGLLGLPPLTVEQWPIDRLIEYARNPRKNDAQVDRMCGAIKEFGFRIPIVAKSDGMVVDGHLRLKAARKLGLTTVPVALADELTDAQIKAFRLLANRSANWASWDEDMLRIELGDLHAEGFDLNLTGFDPGEVAAFLIEHTGGLTDPDAVPEPPANPVSRPGDVWHMGRHRLVCGDSTDPKTVRLALGGVRPHLMVTDPPYGVEYDPAWRNRAGISGTRRTGAVENDHRADWREARALFPGEVAYVWHGALHAPTVAESLTACGFTIRAQIIWAKERLVMGRGHYHWQHEPCWYAVRGTGHWSGDRKQTTLWQIASRNQDTETTHGTQKPVECMKRPIENNSSVGQAVYEPFSGSGSGLIAAEMTGRVCHAVELSPRYVDTAVLRWQAFSGEAAVLESDGASFDAVSASRLTEGIADDGRVVRTDRGPTPDGARIVRLRDSARWDRHSYRCRRENVAQALPGRTRSRVCGSHRQGRANFVPVGDRGEERRMRDLLDEGPRRLAGNRASGKHRARRQANGVRRHLSLHRNADGVPGYPER